MRAQEHFVDRLPAPFVVRLQCSNCGGMQIAYFPDGYMECGLLRGIECDDCGLCSADQVGLPTFMN